MVAPGREVRAKEEKPVNALFATSLTASLCLALTLVLNIAPRLDPTLGNRRVHVGIEVAAAMVLVFIAAVLLGRFRLNGSRRTLLKFGAVVVLALDNLMSAVLTASVDAVSSSSFETWTFALNGLVGAALLAGAALLPDRPVARAGTPIAGVLAASVGIVAFNVVVAALLRGVLPPAFESPPRTGEHLLLLSEHWSVVAAEAATAACFGLAAVAFARLAEKHVDEFLEWLAIGCVIAGIAFVNYALFPSQFTELIYSGDLFFLAAIAVLAYGAVREISREEAAQIRSAVLEERRRVARDLHDGVAQELAYISSQMQWFQRHPDERDVLTHISDAVERALDESRGAIAALSRPMDEPLDVALANAARDVAERVGARLQLDLDAGHRGHRPRWREALLRIAREAVTNAVRHGHARKVSLRAARRRRDLAARDRQRRRLRPRRAALEPELRADEHARAHRVARRQLHRRLRTGRRDARRGRAPMSVRVLVADDHVPTRAGVRMVLEQAGCTVCAEAGTADEAIAAAVAERPDVCLVDVDMPGSGIRAVVSIHARVPSAAILMLTVSRAESDLFDALRAGCIGYLLKDMDPALLPDAVRAAAAGEGVLDGTLTAMLIDEFRHRRTAALDLDHRLKVDLTSRELEVVELLGEGLPTAEIARRLFVSQVTVRRHVSILMGKLGVHSRDELLAARRATNDLTRAFTELNAG